MKTKLTIIVLTMAAAFAAWSQRQRFDTTQPSPLGATEQEKRVLATLEEVQNAGETYLSVRPADGRMLRLLTETAGAKNVVEIGTSTGYSGLWLALALQQTGGKLTTFEIDPARAAMARRHFAKAGVDRIVTVIEGDAHANVSRLKDPIDVVFIDADKDGYVDYLKKSLPLVRPGGLILAHNVNQASDYYELVTQNPALDTVLFTQGGGMAITLRKRN